MGVKKRIAILGGGMAGLSVAYELSKRAEDREKFDITVYQMGWRLGGKCATGRGPNGRIEEHGIHLFGGGYYNALPMMQEVYGALGLNFRDGFEPQYVSVRVEPIGARRVSALEFPSLQLAPDQLSDLGSVSGMAARALRMLRALLLQEFRELVDVRPSGLPFGDLADVLIDALAQTPLVARATQQIDLAIAALTARLAGDNLVQALINVLDAMDTWAQAAEGVARADNAGWFLKLHDAMPTVRFLLALFRGLTIDVLRQGKTFDQLDSQNYDDWLVHHGLAREYLNASIVLAPIRILYQWPKGNAAARASMGAGAYLHWTLRTLAYVEAPFWFFRKGTGESIVRPLYQLLRQRGVRFEFFHRVKSLHLSSNGASIERVEMDVQAKTRGGTPYDPLALVCDQPCWPNEPLWDKLEMPAHSPPTADDMESYWSTWKVGEKTLKADVEGEGGFDHLVFAISLGAVPQLCNELMEMAPAWKAMADRISTVETLNLQLWLAKDSESLGLNLGQVLGRARHDPDDTGLGCGLASPFDGFSDFTELIKHECWPADNKPRSLWYFSDVLDHTNAPDPGAPDYPKQRLGAAAAHCTRFLDIHFGTLQPEAVPGGRFNPALLRPPPRHNEPLLSTQWVKANVQPSDRYVQAPVNTTQFRLWPGNSRFANLSVAGDWTRNGLNVGCVEATVMSGRIAANGLRGRPPGEGVIGYFAG